jgi:transposase
MPTKTKRPNLKLTIEDTEFLTQISQSRKLPKREVDRANILLLFAKGLSIQDISTKVAVSRPSVYMCIDKAAAMGIRAGLKDLPHSPKDPVITPEAKAHITSVACTKPKDLGYAAEVWTMSSLAKHIKQTAEEKGHSCLKSVVKSTVCNILNDNKLKPHKVKYYLEKRDPEFDQKMHEVLLVYKEVELLNTKANDEKSNTVTLSVDEKPGVQAIANTAPDLPPVIGKHDAIGRDHEYVRHGTASILAAIDLHDGHIFAQVHHQHRSIEFIGLLKEIDGYYDKDKRIRVILDNHSAHTSKETREFLGTKPNRFEFVHTPKHGSWLNIIETVFGKMARTFLKHIRVSSWEELRDRILKGVTEINKEPVVHRWAKFDALGLIWGAI